MPEPLSLLVLSNPEDDFSALLEALTGGGFLLRVRHVHSVDEFARSLDTVPCDVALVSDQLASGSGLDGLPFVDARGLEMPFIVVSSNSDPTWMASVMRAGAHDVISRDRLWRLAPAIEREHRQAQLRSQRVRAEAQLRARARQQEVVADLGLRALSEKDLSDLLDQGLRAVADTLDLRLVALFEPVPGRAEVSLKSGVAWVAGSVGKTFGLGGPAESVAPEAHAVVEYVLAHPAECPAVLGEYGVVSGLSVVVRGAHAPVGVLGAYTSVPRTFTRDDVNFLQAVANVIAGAIMRWTAEEDQLKSHQRLLSVQRMEAIGRLAGGIAHDFNNLVQAIGGYSEVMLQRLPEGDVLRSHAEEIKKAGDRAAALTRQLLAFSRQQVLQPKVIDLNTVVFNMEELLRRLIGAHIELKAKPAADLWTLKADVAQIEQVLMNLAVNSRDAMSEGGTLSITTTNVRLPQAGERESFPVTPGPYVELVVEDSGCGMSPEIRARAFEPFFTTKEPGKGTGLGLSTVYGIVKQSGGYIWVDSEVGHGTRIRICLPRAGEVAPPVEVRRAPSTQVPRGSETLLLVEDEEGVRELMRDYLSAHGYQVLVATNGSEAMARCEEFEGRIEVLIADVVMPQMGGPALTKKLLPLRPDMKIVYVSGYADEALGDHRVLESGAAFLQKPFSLESLVRKVREILDVPTPTV